MQYFLHSCVLHFINQNRVHTKHNMYWITGRDCGNNEVATSSLWKLFPDNIRIPILGIGYYIHIKKREVWDCATGIAIGTVIGTLLKLVYDHYSGAKVDDEKENVIKGGRRLGGAPRGTPAPRRDAPRPTRKYKRRAGENDWVTEERPA